MDTGTITLRVFAVLFGLTSSAGEIELGAARSAKPDF